MESIEKNQIRDIRLSKPSAVKRLINQQINDVRKDENMDTETKARTIGYLSNILLKSIEQGEMAERMEYVYQKLKEQDDKNKKRR